MKKIDLGQTISILANLGVIAGIVFLGIELQQNNALMESEARRARSAFTEQANLMIATDAELASLILRDAQGESLPELESFRLSRFWYASLSSLEGAYLELSPEELDALVVRWRVLYSINPALREMWSTAAAGFDAGFAAWVNDSVIVHSE